MSNPELSITNGRHVIVDVLEFKDGSRHEWVYFKGLGTKPGAVAVAALTEDNKIILTKQYRHPMGKAIYDTFQQAESMKAKHRYKQLYES